MASPVTVTTSMAVPPPSTRAPLVESKIGDTSLLGNLSARLGQIDELVSRPIFRLGLPKWVEFWFSVPSNFFGTTSCLAIGPLWIALLGISQQRLALSENDDDKTRILLLQIIVVSTTAMHLVAWGRFQIQEDYALGRKLFWNSLLYPAAYPWAVGILAYTVLGLHGDPSVNYESNDSLSPKELFAIAIYPLTLWPLVALPMSEFKKSTRRSRPAKKDLERGTQGEQWAQHKKFPLMTNMLAQHNGDASFPSGDVAMATLLALPLWYMGHPKLAVGVVFLSSMGRMYVLAHHLSDVVAGSLLTLGVHGIGLSLGYGVHKAEWWHPLLTIGLFVTLVLVTKKGSNPMEKQGGAMTTTDSKKNN